MQYLDQKQQFTDITFLSETFSNIMVKNRIYTYKVKNFIHKSA